MNDPDDTLERAILRQAPDAVIFSDAAGIIREWNDRAQSLFGYSREEAIGLGLDLIIPERLREKHWQGFNAAVAGGRTRTGGAAIVTRADGRGGATLYVEMSFSLVVGEGGTVIGAVAIARDVTAKHLASRPAKAT